MFETNLDFIENMGKISIFVTIFEKISILVKSSEKSHWSQNFRKFVITVIAFDKSELHIHFQKDFKDLDFSQNFRKISILVAIFEKYRFQSKSSKTLNFSKKFGTISVIITMFEKSRFHTSFQKFFENRDFSLNLRKIAILVKIFENLDFCQICGKSHSFVKVFRKSWHHPELSKTLDFDHNFRF